MKARFCYVLLALTVLAPLPAAGQVVALLSAADGAAPEDDAVETVKLVLHPAAEPRPALKYQLLPPLVDRRPGNAAVVYGKVAAAQRDVFGNDDLSGKIDAWLNVPLDEFPKDEARNALGLHGGGFKLLDQAARCEYVDWQLPLRDERPFDILLPELSQNRRFARVLAAEVRLHLAAGELDEAVHALQTGFAMGRHVGQEPTIISGLVGIAIMKMMSQQIETLVQQPGAPNLYWALTQLPEPPIDLRVGIEAESSLLALWFPEIRDIEHADLTPQQWNEILRKVMTGILSVSQGQPAQPAPMAIATGAALRGYPMATRGLIERGYDPAAVEAMPVAKAVLLYTVLQYEELRDDVFKWFFVPYWEGREGAASAEESLKAVAPQREVIPLASVLLPAIAVIHRRDAEARRTIAALRVIEAIRLYGAAHDGSLPVKLADVTEVPIPIDPTTGQPFEYLLSGKTAVLQSPGGRRGGLRYEITFAAKGD